MSKHSFRAAIDPNDLGWRAGAARVLANALLVLLAYLLVSFGAVAAEVILTGWTPPATVGEGATPGLEGAPFVLYAALFYLVRWLYVLPGLIVVLIAIEVVARRAPHARILTAVVAFAPALWWELTQEATHPSGHGILLSVTAVLFAVLARLPARFPVHPTEDGEAAQPPAGTAVAPR